MRSSGLQIAVDIPLPVGDVKCAEYRPNLYPTYAGGDRMDAPLNSLSSISEENIRQVLHFLEEIQYGSITLVINDGKVVFIEKQEKIKLS